MCFGGCGGCVVGVFTEELGLFSKSEPRTRPLCVTELGRFITSPVVTRETLSLASGFGQSWGQWVPVCADP